MQLLQDVFIVEKLQVLNEGAQKDTMRIRGVFGRCNEKNNNGRIYPTAVLENQLAKVQPLIQERRLCGELDHPSNDSVKLSNASHLITKLEIKGNELIGEAEILKTPAGLTAKALIDGGVRIGISSRGMGTLSEDSKGNKVVNEDFRLITFDLVADPSTRGAFPTLAESTQSRFARESQSKLQKESNFVVMLKSKLREAYQPILEEKGTPKEPTDPEEAKRFTNAMKRDPHRLEKRRKPRGGRRASDKEEAKRFIDAMKKDPHRLKESVYSSGHYHRMGLLIAEGMGHRVDEIIGQMLGSMAKNAYRWNKKYDATGKAANALKGAAKKGIDWVSNKWKEWREKKKGNLNPRERMDARRAARRAGQKPGSELYKPTEKRATLTELPSRKPHERPEINPVSGRPQRAESTRERLKRKRKEAEETEKFGAGLDDEFGAGLKDHMNYKQIGLIIAEAMGLLEYKDPKTGERYTTPAAAERYERKHGGGVKQDLGKFGTTEFTKTGEGQVLKNKEGKITSVRPHGSKGKLQVPVKLKMKESFIRIGKSLLEKSSERPYSSDPDERVKQRKEGGDWPGHSDPKESPENQWTTDRRTTGFSNRPKFGKKFHGKQRGGKFQGPARRQIHITHSVDPKTGETKAHPSKTARDKARKERQARLAANVKKVSGK
jgi:hypothetical protein